MPLFGLDRDDRRALAVMLVAFLLIICLAWLIGDVLHQLILIATQCFEVIR